MNYGFELDPAAWTSPSGDKGDPLLLDANDPYGLPCDLDTVSVLECGDPADPALDSVSSWNKTRDQVVVSRRADAYGAPAPGLDVTIRRYGEAPETLSLFEGDVVLSAYGQWYDGELYVVAVVEDTPGDRSVYLAYGPPDLPLDEALLNYNVDDLPDRAKAAIPSEVALFVDAERIAVAMTMVDESAGEGEYNDTVGWLFLGPPN